MWRRSSALAAMATLATAVSGHAQAPTASRTVTDLSLFTRSPLPWSAAGGERATGGGGVERFAFAAPRPDTPAAGQALWLQGPASLEGYSLSYTREWPLSWTGATNRYGVELAPHAGFGVASYGPSAEAGAEIRIGALKQADLGGQMRQRLRDLGVDPVKGAVLGSRSRWYLFAAASGQAVGLNLRRDEDGWTNAGWSEDRTSGFVTSAQAGLAWRLGPAQASIGYVRRKIKTSGPQSDLYADLPKNDDVAGFTFSYTPQ